jgi:hypothetical protein
VENACGHARRFHERGFEVIVTDVLTPETLQLSRRHLPGCLIVRLHVFGWMAGSTTLDAGARSAPAAGPAGVTGSC